MRLCHSSITDLTGASHAETGIRGFAIPPQASAKTSKATVEVRNKSLSIFSHFYLFSLLFCAQSGFSLHFCTLLTSSRLSSHFYSFIISARFSSQLSLHFYPFLLQRLFHFYPCFLFYSHFYLFSPYFPPIFLQKPALYSWPQDPGFIVYRLIFRRFSVFFRRIRIPFLCRKGGQAKQIPQKPSRDQPLQGGESFPGRSGPGLLS